MISVTLTTGGLLVPDWLVLVFQKIQKITMSVKVAAVLCAKISC